MRIGELAQRTDCDVETIRYYEREGLLKAPVREANGYRCYGSEHLAQLNFIRHCRSLDISLLDVRTLQNFKDNPELVCDEVNHLIDNQIQRIHQQVESLKLLELQLQSLRETCQANRKVGECGIMKNLEQDAKADECSCHTPEFH
jgi:Cd(II)/Pb(II)-responsive transcriptional regulator